MHVKFDNVDMVINSKSFTVNLYYIKGEDGFVIVDERPGDSDYGEVEVTFELNGIMGGPAVTMWENMDRKRRGELLDLARPGSSVSLDIPLPEGGAIARDGIGDWTKIINLSNRPNRLIRD